MKFWNFRNEQTDEKPLAGAGNGTGDGLDGVLDIDGEIVAEEGWFTEGCCVAKNFREALKGYRNVRVRINSPGGDVMAGADIYSALREHSLNGEGTITVEIAALAASAASIIAMAGDKILMSPVAYMMIHNPWTFAMGDAKEMRKAAKTLDVISEGLINAYQIRTGKTRDELKRLLDNETWMSAGTCVTEGFADAMIGMEDGDTQAVACLMAGKSHGAGEIAARIRMMDKDPDEDDPEEDDPEEGGQPGGDDPDEGGSGDDPDETGGNDPDESGSDPDGEDPEEEEKKKRAEQAAALAGILAEAMAAWESSFFGEEQK